MGIRDLIKDAGRAVASSLSLSTQATLTGKAPNQVDIPQATTDAMTEQGMNTGGAFSPGTPISPYQSVGTSPIITPYQVGQNIFAVPRGITGVGFDSLKNITSRWDVAQLCIEVRLDEIRGLDWEIVAEDGTDANKYDSELRAARKFFEHPSPGQDFDDLHMKGGEDWLRYDALTFARRRTKNGKLGALEAIDGTTISPLIDGRGATPQGDAPAYVQWAWGLPWVWLTERDIIYKPFHPRPESRYGKPPAEWVMLTANTDMRLQWYFLTYFTEGAIPEAFINAPPDVNDPTQVKALQTAYEAVMSGAQAVHHKAKWIPAGANVHVINKANFDTGFAGYMLAKACAAWKVQPAEIGFTEKVNKSSGDTQADVTYRRAIKPTVKYFESIWNRILREDFNMPYARFKYLNIEEEEDQLKLANTRSVYIQNGVLSADEVRQELGYDIDESAPVGRAFATRTGLIFVDPESQKKARESGSLAQQAAGVAPVTESNQPDDPNADSNAETPQMLTPDQTIVDPALKPQPPKQGAPQVTSTTDQGAPAPTKAVEDELKKWRTVALKRAKDGKAHKAFVSTVLDPLLCKVIDAQVQHATTPDEVKAVFAPLLGDNVNFTKRVAPKRGRIVTRDQTKLDLTSKQLKDAIAKMLAQTAPKIAKHVGEGLRTLELSDTVPDETMLELLLRQFGWQGWDKHVIDATKPGLEAIFAQAAIEGADAVGASLAFGLVRPQAVTYAEKRAAELVGKVRLPDGTLVDNPNVTTTITDSTRQFLKTTITQAVKSGQSTYEIEQAILKDYAFSDARAETIARTETGFAYNHGSVAGFRDARVTHVEVMDGEDDAECAEADGQIWTLEDADANPLAHPNCVRSFAPIPPDEDEEG